MSKRSCSSPKCVSSSPLKGMLHHQFPPWIFVTFKDHLTGIDNYAASLFRSLFSLSLNVIALTFECLWRPKATKLLQSMPQGFHPWLPFLQNQTSRTAFCIVELYLNSDLRFKVVPGNSWIILQRRCSVDKIVLFHRVESWDIANRWKR